MFFNTDFFFLRIKGAHISITKMRTVRMYELDLKHLNCRSYQNKVKRPWNVVHLL